MSPSRWRYEPMVPVCEIFRSIRLDSKFRCEDPSQPCEQGPTRTSQKRRPINHINSRFAFCFLRRYMEGPCSRHRMICKVLQWRWYGGGGTVHAGLTAIGLESFCICALGSVPLCFELRALLLRRFMTRDGKGTLNLLVLTERWGFLHCTMWYY